MENEIINRKEEAAEIEKRWWNRKTFGIKNGAFVMITAAYFIIWSLYKSSKNK